MLGAWLAACACGVMAQSAQPAPGVPLAGPPIGRSEEGRGGEECVGTPGGVRCV